MAEKMPILVVLGMDIDGKPVLNVDGYAKLTMRHDERGHRIEAAYLGVDGQPVLLKNGYAFCTARYDERGNQIEEVYLGGDRQPVLRKEGFAKWMDKYDERGNRIERAWFGVDARPVEVNGSHRFTQTYDATGNVLEKVCYDARGKIVPDH